MLFGLDLHTFSVNVSMFLCLFWFRNRKIEPNQTKPIKFGSVWFDCLAYLKPIGWYYVRTEWFGSTGFSFKIEQNWTMNTPSHQCHQPSRFSSLPRSPCPTSHCWKLSNHGPIRVTSKLNLKSRRCHLFLKKKKVPFYLICMLQWYILCFN